MRATASPSQANSLMTSRGVVTSGDAVTWLVVTSDELTVVASLWLPRVGDVTMHTSEMGSTNLGEVEILLCLS